MARKAGRPLKPTKSVVLKHLVDAAEGKAIGQGTQEARVNGAIHDLWMQNFLSGVQEDVLAMPSEPTAVIIDPAIADRTAALDLLSASVPPGPLLDALTYAVASPPPGMVDPIVAVTKAVAIIDSVRAHYLKVQAARPKPRAPIKRVHSPSHFGTMKPSFLAAAKALEALGFEGIDPESVATTLVRFRQRVTPKPK